MPIGNTSFSDAIGEDSKYSGSSSCISQQLADALSKWHVVGANLRQITFTQIDVVNVAGDFEDGFFVVHMGIACIGGEHLTKIPCESWPKNGRKKILKTSAGFLLVTRRAHRQAQPATSFGVCPIEFHSGQGNIQRGRGLLIRQSGEEPQLNDLGGAWVLRREPVNGLTQGDQVDVRPHPFGGNLRQIDSGMMTACLRASFATCIFHKNSSHGFGGRGEEMPPVIPSLGLAGRQGADKPHAQAPSPAVSGQAIPFPYDLLPGGENSSYTSGNSSDDARESPDSILSRMRVTSVIPRL